MTDEWMAEYGRSLYLRELPDAGLTARMEHIEQNLWSTGPNSEVTPPRSPENRSRLIKIYVHCVAEQIRRGKVIHSISEADIRRRASKDYRTPDLIAPFTGSPRCWVKFGKRMHIRDAFDRGALKITLASAYNDPSLNAAQRDDELNHLSRTPNTQMSFSLRGNSASGNDIDLPYHSLEYFEGIRAKDYYVWCCSAEYDVRIFGNFEDYDAALIVRDQQEFSNRLEQAMKNRVPASNMQSGRVGYYDPFDINPASLRPMFVKNFQYMYQHEYRFTWEVDNNKSEKNLFIEIGPLSEVCEILEMHPRKNS